MALTDSFKIQDLVILQLNNAFLFFSFFFSFLLTVYAKDGGLPPNYAKATVRIRVLDENDNTPFFGRFYYSIEVPENLEAIPLFTLRANDQDAGENGKMNYKLTGENLCFNTFLENRS